MAHEIGQYDNVVLHKDRAWHGLGIIVEKAPTPREAVRIQTSLFGANAIRGIQSLQLALSM